MMQKTIRGKKCPQCASFIKADQAKCSVCGFDFDIKDKPKQEETELPVTVRTDSGGALCPKCKTINNAEFKFCKICKYPLQEDPFSQDKKTKKIRLTCAWLKPEARQILPDEQGFSDFLPYFDGCLQWQGYGFCVYKHKSKFEILCRKTGTTVDTVLYKKCLDTTIAASGKEFFIGAVKIKLMGDTDSRVEQQTVVSSDKTVFIGPGETQDDHSAKTGLPRLKICDPDLQPDTVEIGEKVLLGRNFLGKHTGLDYEVMRKNGVSSEHLFLTPLPGAGWLVEPLPEKPIFTEISEAAIILHPGDILRLVSKEYVGEFEIGIKESRY
ncbi:MAG: hypothetical protein KAT34_21795 [Candidatus Aminicenantes bacterium]|nr:hypothetical protein [Candidatus Aminicenantes bacterium]